MTKKMAAALWKKTLSQEAQLIIGVLDQCVQKIDLLSLLPHEPVHPVFISRELGDTAARSLQEHLRVSKEYQSLRDTTKDMKITQDVQDTLRNLLRQVRPYMEAEPVKAMLHAAGSRIEEEQKEIKELVAVLRKLRDIVLEQLMTTPSEVQEHRRHDKEVRETQENSLETLTALEMDIEKSKIHQKNMIIQKDGEIQHLNDSLHETERALKEFQLHSQKTGEQQHQSDLRNSELKQLPLQEETSQLQAQHDVLLMQHWEKELMLSRKQKNLETEIRNWIQKYDEDMEEKQVKLERLTQAYEEEQAELHKLQEHFSVLELEYSQIMEERRRERERRDEEEREREAKRRAAVVIQALWRGWQVRKDLKNKAKSKKGKKGKKGKAKKGK